MTISVVEARNLVVLAVWGGSRGDPNSFHVAPSPNTTLEAALEVYFEARVSDAYPVRYVTAVDTVEPVETWRGGDRVLMSGVSKYGRTVNGLIGVVDDNQYHRPLVSVTPEIVHRVLVQPDQLTRI